LQRFQLLCWPDAPPPWAKVARYPDERAATRAEGVYLRLHRASAAALGAEPRTRTARVPGLVFDVPGQEIYDRWQRDFEPLTRSADFAGTGALRSHLGKYRSLLPKLAMVLHLADNPSGPVGELATMQAVGWIAWLEQHARKVYAGEEAPDVAAARALAEKLRAGALGETPTVRDIYRPHWRGIDDRETVDLALAYLTDRCWLRVRPEPGKGRPRQVVDVNPAIWELDQ
jgi:putative DNA primase/helicase